MSGFVWPVRPESGRRPDDAGLPDDTWVLGRLPALLETGGVYVAICSHAVPQAHFEAPNDTAAIARVLTLGSPGALACDVTVEEAARVAGLPVVPLEGAALELFAVLAMVVRLSRAVTREAFESGAMMRFAWACAGFAWNRPWEHEITARLLEVRACIPGEPDDLTTLVLPPDTAMLGPGVGLVTHDVELAIGETDPSIVNVKGPVQMLIVFEPAPDDLRGLLRRAFETELFPLCLSLRGGKSRVFLSAREVRLLTGVLECVTELMHGAESAHADVDGMVVAIQEHPHGPLVARQPPAAKA